MKLFHLLFVFFLINAPTAYAQENCNQFAVALATTAVPPQQPSAFRATLNLIQKRPSEADVILVGDSMLANWKSIKKDTGNDSIWNYSVGFDTTQNTLWRLNQIDLTSLAPKYVVLWVGTNNLITKEVDACAIVSGIRASVEKIKIELPDAVVFVMPLLPRGADFKDFNDVRLKANLALKELNEISGVFLVDVDDATITCGGYDGPKLPPSTMACAPETALQCDFYKPDHLHLADATYLKLREILSSASLKATGRDLFAVN